MNETTVFREALGNTPVIKVLDFLIEGRGLDYSLTDIAENAHIGWTTLHRIWDNLLKLGIVVHTRQIGRAKLFRLNVDNPAVKDLIRMYDSLLYQQNQQLFDSLIKMNS